MDREASRGNKKDKEKGGKRKESGGEEEVVAVEVGRGMSHVSSPVYPEDGRLAGGGGILCFETVGTTGVSNCRTDKPQPRPCQAGVTGVWW